MAESVAGGDERRDALAKRRKGRRRMALAIALVVILIPALYLFVIPRTEVNLRVYYNESVLNNINIDFQVSNTGTNVVESLTLSVAVLNSTDSEMGKKEYSVGKIAPVMGIAKLDALTFRGSQYERYTIVIDLELRAGGTTLSRHWSHGTEEPYLNLDWTDRVS